MNLRDELNRRLTDFDLDVSEDFIDTLLPWLEQKLAEAQAEMVERCAQALEHLAADLLTDLAVETARTASKIIRALSPDPHARERWERTAYIEGVKSVYVQHDHAIAGVCGAACPLKLRDLRVAELERQLGTLSAVTL